MMRQLYFLVSPTDEVTERARYDSPPLVQTKPGYRWLPYVVVNADYDSSTQERTGPVRVISDTEVTDTFTIRNYTADELAASAEANKVAYVDSIDRLQFLVMFDMENRVRVLEGKSPVTAANYRNALKARL